MFKNNQLKTTSESLNFSIDKLEDTLSNYKDYLSIDKKKALLNKIQGYKYLHLEIKLLLGNEEISKVLDELEDRDSGQLNRNALNT
ncbi:hypothetical protein [Tepidibacter aestuarii]|uniref:hypothetical protein n=1 Tax=Tepidibacter aestuarii TaxID=2925782 RepID=UPI0020C0B32A|nr:hypothetical protein [Tepidibacter aestuarii]CAH2215077.1 protein of unknown function [Tepidibacter aestuarii]